MSKILELHPFQWIFKVDFLYDWLVWSPCHPRDFQEFSPARKFKSINSLALSLLYGPTLTSTHDYWKTKVLTLCTFVGKVMSVFNTFSKLIIAFLSRSKFLLIPRLQSLFTVILELKKRKSLTASTIFHEVMKLDITILVFWMLSFKLAFSLSSFIFIKRLFSSSYFLPLECYHLHIWGCWYFSQQSCCIINATTCILKIKTIRLES